VSLLLAIAALSAFRYQPPQAPRAASPRITVPVKEICDVQSSASTCANREFGNNFAGASVIAWSAGDNNNAFDWVFLAGMCNGGRVSANPPCPFNPGGGLNSRYNGAWIAEMEDLDSSAPTLCLADNGQGDGSTVLNTCPDFQGNGGGNGTIFVLAQANPLDYLHTTTYAVNRYWSNNPAGGNGTSPRWLCDVGKGFDLWEDSPYGSAGTCQWNELCPGCSTVAPSTNAHQDSSPGRSEARRERGRRALS
jgi:hypothetical protein